MALSKLLGVFNIVVAMVVIVVVVNLVFCVFVFVMKIFLYQSMFIIDSWLAVIFPFE